MERFKILLLVGSGGFIGSALRYLIASNTTLKFFSSVPSGTLLVNVLGCFIIGILFGISETVSLPSNVKFFLAAGFCGGFTTFSAFSAETFSMLKGEMIGTAFAYIIASVLLGLVATFLGIICTRLF